MRELIERLRASAGGEKRLEEASPAGLSDSELELFNRVVLSAVNEGRFYKTRDAKGAVKAATKSVLDTQMDELKDDARAVEKLAIKEVKRQWSGK